MLAGGVQAGARSLPQANASAVVLRPAGCPRCSCCPATVRVLNPKGAPANWPVSGQEEVEATC